MSTGDAIVLAVVLLLIAGAIFSLVRSYISGRCSCGCDRCSCSCGCGKVVEVEDEKH